MVRALLAEPGRAWRLEELGRAAEVSLGHSHNVVKRLEDLRWVERDGAQRIQLAKLADLLEGWSESYTYRSSEMASYFVPERVTRRLMADLARTAVAEGRRYAFTLERRRVAGGAAHRGWAAIHCYLDGDPAPIAAALGLHPAGEADGALHLLSPYDPGVFYGLLDKAGSKVVSLPQLYADLMRYERRGRRAGRASAPRSDGLLIQENEGR